MCWGKVMGHNFGVYFALYDRACMEDAVDVCEIWLIWLFSMISCLWSMTWHDMTCYTGSCLLHEHANNVMKYSWFRRYYKYSAIIRVVFANVFYQVYFTFFDNENSVIFGQVVNEQVLGKIDNKLTTSFFFQVWPRRGWSGRWYTLNGRKNTKSRSPGGAGHRWARFHAVVEQTSPSDPRDELQTIH